MQRCMLIIHIPFSELIDSSIIDAIDGSISFEKNSPFPSNIKVLSIQDYQRLLHSLYLKRPSPDATFKHTSHFNAKQYLQDRVIHVSKPIGHSTTKRCFDYPLVNTSIGIVPLSFVQTQLESAQLRCCGFVQVPLYELDSSTPIELKLPEPMRIEQPWSAPEAMEKSSERRERERRSGEEQEQQGKQMEVEMPTNAKPMEGAGNAWSLGNAESNAVSGEKQIQRVRTVEV